MATDATSPDWKTNGLRIVRANNLDTNTPQTPGMTRAEAISHARVGAQKFWAGTVVVHPNAKTGPHHHGELETVIYIVRGRARFRWGARLEFVDEAGPGDFVYVPPYVPHQELNAKRDEPVEAVIVRSGQEPVVVNLDIPTPDQIPLHRNPTPSTRKSPMEIARKLRIQFVRHLRSASRKKAAPNGAASFSAHFAYTSFTACRRPARRALSPQSR